MDTTAKLRQLQNIESLLYQVQGSNFTNFEQMQIFLDNAEVMLDQKVQQLTNMIQSSQQQLQRTAGVYQLNNKKRQKDTQILQLQRKKIVQNMQKHKQRLNFAIHPMTLVLKQKQSQIVRRTQTKQIIKDFNLILNGNQEQMQKTLLLDDKNFNSSALKIYVFKCVLEQLKNPQYQLVHNFVKRRFLQLKTKIISTFKQGFLKNDVIIINNIMPYCEQYQLMDEIADYYNTQAFKQSTKINKIQTANIQLQIKNFFFLIKRGFTYAFGAFAGTQKNNNRISNLLEKYSDFISRKLIAYVFQQLVKPTVDSVLKTSSSVTDYLLSLQTFYAQCKNLIKYCEQLLQQQRLCHLMQTHVESILDIYLQNYLNRQMSSLQKLYGQNISNLVQQIRSMDLVRQQRNEPVTTKKFSFKNLYDYKLPEKKVYDSQFAKNKLKKLSSLFMDVSLQKIFQVTKYALNRNNKISKINETYEYFSAEIETETKFLVFLQNSSVSLSKLQFVRIFYLNRMGDIIPKSEDNTPQQVETQFFIVIPQINVLLQRMEYLYSEYKKQAKYQLSQSIKLQQKKQNLLATCQKQMNDIVASALACILTSQNQFIRQRKIYMKAQLQPISNKLYQMMQRYIRAIQKITQIRYRTSLLKTMGIQFVVMLIDHYSAIAYNKDGLGGIFVDVSAYGKIIKLFNLPVVQEKYKSFKCLIDIYVLRNDQKQLENYVQSQRQGALKGQKQAVIRKYIQNKKLIERNV